MLVFITRLRGGETAAAASSLSLQQGGEKGWARGAPCLILHLPGSP